MHKVYNIKRDLYVRLLFVFVLTYQSFHYILQYGDINTSPTYTATPVIFQIFKYVFTLLLLIPVYSTAKYYKKLNFASILFLLILLNLFVYNILVYPNIDINELKYILLAAMLIPILFFSRSSIKVFYRNKDFFIYSSVAYVILTNLYVIFNYIYFNRLTAQAYEGDLFNRFAGFWDMPNAFGAFNVFLLFILLKRGNFLLAIFLFFNVIFTFSLSSYVVLLFALLIYSFKSLRKLAVLLSVFVFSIILLFIKQDILLKFLEQKKGSIMEHLSFFDNVNYLPIFDGHLSFNESFLFSFFNNYNVIALVTFIGLIMLLIKNCKEDMYTYYILFFIVGSIFIPQIYVFPNNFIFLLFVILLIKKDRKVYYEISN